MIASPRRIARLAALLAVVSAFPVAPSRAEGSGSCEANVQGSYRTEELFERSKDKIFAVQISTPAPCARVFFDLVTTERLFDGEEIRTTTPNWRKVTAGAEAGFKVRFSMARDTELVDWKIQYKSCEVCGK
jgi:hypothetical protein